MIHELKTWPEYFQPVLDGRKTFEVRKIDRPFKVGDTLLLRKYDPEEEKYTGLELSRTISYILRGGEFGIEEGYCVLGLKQSASCRCIETIGDTGEKDLTVSPQCPQHGAMEQSEPESKGDLKPCPFCGSNGLDLEWNEAGESIVKCGHCGAQSCGCVGVDSCETAKKAWNNRPQQSEPESKECEFTCPNCGGNHWGTNTGKDGVSYGQCHRIWCNFRWDRKEDEKYFKPKSEPESKGECCVNSKKLLENEICTWNFCPVCGTKIRDVHVVPVSQRGLWEDKQSEPESREPLCALVDDNKLPPCWEDCDRQTLLRKCQIDVNSCPLYPVGSTRIPPIGGTSQSGERCIKLGLSKGEKG